MHNKFCFLLQAVARNLTRGVLLVCLMFSAQNSHAGLFSPTKVAVQHPMAVVIMAAAGYTGIKAYCAAGAPAASVDDGSGRPRMARIDCATVGAGMENKLGAWSEQMEASDGLLSNIKRGVAYSATRELRKSLNILQTANGMPPDPDDCDAHHIVPKREARPWAARSAKAARDAIDGCVDIDDAENGIYLPNKNTGSSQCIGSYHKTLHTKDYYDKLAARLTQARLNGGCLDVRRELSVVKQLLQAGAL